MAGILESRLPKEDRVRQQTSAGVNERLDNEMKGRILTYKDKSESEISERIDELEQEWDIERFLELNASGLALTGVLMGILGSKRWLLFSGVVLGFLMRHAVQGWCPPVPPLRRLGIRTRQEIDREKFALKALRGDFSEELKHGGPLTEDITTLLSAVEK